MITKIYQNNSDKVKILFFILSVIVSLFIWLKSPIYPDEFAFRVSRLRYIYDNYKVFDLHGLCTQGEVYLPFIFRPAAWVLSYVHSFSILNPFQLRVLPILTLLLIIFALVNYTYKINEKDSIYYLSFAFIGVAGSGQIILRHEFIILLLIAFCFIGLSCSISSNLSKIKTILLILLILFISTCSNYIHSQGLLFIPFVSFVIYRICKNSSMSKRLNLIVISSVIFFINLLIYGSFILNKVGCAGSTEIDKSFSEMTLKIEDMNNINFIYDKIYKYLDSFLYKSEYLTNYLPGVVDLNNIVWLSVLNFIIIISLTLIVLINIYYFSKTTTQIVFSSNLNSLFAKINAYGIPLLLIIPALFLLIYDKNQYFYRSIFINIILCISLVCFSSNKYLKHKIYFHKTMGFVGFIVLSVSIFANYKYFYYMLPDWSAIYSVSINKFLSNREDKIDSVINKCKVDLNNDKFILDEYTYDYLKNSINPQIIYYVSYQSSITKKSTSEIMSILNINSVLASCSSMERSGVGWPSNFSVGDICCSKETKK